jgi:hypothetical protein
MNASIEIFRATSDELQSPQLDKSQMKRMFSPMGNSGSLCQSRDIKRYQSALKEQQSGSLSQFPVRSHSGK